MSLSEMRMWAGSVKLTTKSDPDFVIVDSNLEWKIEDAWDLLGKTMVSKKILLMEYPEAYWQVF